MYNCSKTVDTSSNYGVGVDTMSWSYKSMNLVIFCEDDSLSFFHYHPNRVTSFGTVVQRRGYRVHSYSQLTIKIL